MSNYKLTAKRLGIKVRIWKYGFVFRHGLKEAPNYKLLRTFKIVPLDGWEFDSHRIVESIANDPDMSIKYGKGES